MVQNIFLLGAYVRNMQKKFQDDLAKSATNAEETLSSMRTVRSFSQEPKADADYAKGIDASFEVGKKLSLASGNFFNDFCILFGINFLFGPLINIFYSCFRLFQYVYWCNYSSN